MNYYHYGHFLGVEKNGFGMINRFYYHIVVMVYDIGVKIAFGKMVIAGVL